MLQAINDRIKGWLGAMVIVLITIPFAFWGIESYLGGGKEFAAIIDGEEIPVFQFENAYANQLAKLNKQYGENLPLSNNQIKSQVMDQMINTRVLEDNSYASGYRISDAGLKKGVTAIFTREGRFDRDYFENFLAYNGMTVNQYEYTLRNEMRILQKQNGLVSSSIMTDEEARQLAALEQQTREISLIRYKLNVNSPDIKITEEDIDTHYQSNAAQYMTPERVSVEYVELTSDNLAEDIELDESRVQAMYDEYKQSVLKNEERKARHILLQTGESDDKTKDVVLKRIQELQQRLQDGASFEDLAREYSEDPGSAKQGGDLDWVSAGQMVKPFEDALFNLNKGEISDVVETRFGLHLIKLDDMRSGEIKSYAEKRDDFARELQQEMISGMFYDASENMAITAYENPDSLDAVIDVVDVPSTKTDLFTRAGGAGLASNEKFRNTAFSSAVLQDGLNSDVIELSPEHVVVMRLLKHEPASPVPLEQVRARIENELKFMAARDKALADAMNAKNRIADGASPESVLAGDQSIENPAAFSRRDAFNMDPFIGRATFLMPHPENNLPSVQEVNTQTGEIAVIVLDKVNTPSDITQEQIEAVKQKRSADIASAEFSYALSTMRSAADIEKNTGLLQ